MAFVPGSAAAARAALSPRNRRQIAFWLLSVAALIFIMVLVGGATRMSAVQQLVATLFGRLPYRHLDPDTIVALGAACELAMQNMEKENTEVKRLRDKLEKGILAQVTHAFPTGNPENRLPNTSNIAFEYVEGEAILLLLNKMGIACSSGSACTSGSLEPSHVMRAMGIPYTAAHGTIRFSLSVDNTEAEIDRVIEAVPPIIAQLRKLSPYWRDGGPVSAEEAFAPTYA